MGTIKYNPPKTVCALLNIIEYDGRGGARVHYIDIAGKDQWVWMDVSAMSAFLSDEQIEKLERDIGVNRPG